MPKNNQLKSKLLFLLFFFVLLWSGFNLTVRADSDDENETYVDINEDTVWRAADNLNFTKTVHVNSGATLTIEKGANIKFGKDINGDDTYLSVGDGRLIAEGTPKEPISITGDLNHSYSLVEFHGRHQEGVPDPALSFLRYVDVSKGGYEWEDGCPGCTVFWRSLISPVYAETEGSPAVYFTGGKVHVENSTFHDNVYADIGIEYDEFDSRTGTDNYLEIVNSNFEKSGDSAAVRTTLYCKNGGLSCANKILLKNDWYGSSLGPDMAGNQNSNGKKILGYASTDGWRANNFVADPTIIIPGIMGSATQFVGGIGQLKLDPILHTYDNLILSFKKNGYAENLNLFEFPYEWRNKNAVAANDLRTKIQSIKNDTKISKVDIVAHSMGGLIARSYIEGLDYQNDVDQLITLGTPHNGSPKAYMYWEAGEGFFSIEDKIGKYIFELEAYHSNPSYTDLGKYIREKVPSVAELLPDYDYLKEASFGNMKTYPTGYPENGFLDSLNSQANLNNLSKVNFFNIIGNIENSEKTVKDFKVVNSTVSGSWEHGMPENFYDSSGTRGIEYGQGDETVPFSSADGILADKKIALNSSHGNLPTIAQCEVIKELTGKIDCQPVGEADRIINVLTFGVFSPIDIQIVDENNNWVGKNILGLESGEDKQIAGAYYSGSDSANEFVTVPDPNGKYRIITQGTGSGGAYTIEAAKISENGTTNETKESSVEILGSATPGQKGEKSVEVVEDKLTSPDAKDTPPPRIVNINFIIFDINHYFDLGLIKKDAERKLLITRLRIIGNFFDFLNSVKNDKKINAKAKVILTKTIGAVINLEINLFTSQLRNKNNFKSVDQGVKNLLIEDLNYLKIK